MDQPLREFGATAKALSRNPLGIISLFIVLVYGLACLVVITGGSLSSSERLPIVYFLIVFPFVVLGVFTYLVAFRAGQLFAPGDFRKEETYLELQRMRVSAAVSLTAAKQTKYQDRAATTTIRIDDVVQSVESAVMLAQKGAENPLVLWVDDNPLNNIYEQKALEAVGIRFILSEYYRRFGNSFKAAVWRDNLGHGPSRGSSRGICPSGCAPRQGRQYPIICLRQ